MSHRLSHESVIPTFIPEHKGKTRRPPVMPTKLAKIIDKASSTKQIAAAWEQWLNEDQGPCPGYRIAMSQDKSALKDKKTGSNDKWRKIVAALYKEEDAPTDGRQSWETSQLLIEFNSPLVHEDYDSDSTSDDEDGDGGGEKRRNVEQQITTYVENALSLQHRGAMFFLLVHGNCLWVKRWDRSGISTESFKYTSERARLRDILWGFSRLDAGQQGFDTTAILLTSDSDEYKLMDDLKIDHDGTDISEADGTVVTKAQEQYTFHFVRKAFAESIADGVPRYCMTVPVGNEERRFLVGKATFVSTRITGRGTRGFVAWDVTGKRFTFLKDAWRRRHQTVSTEGQVLRNLMTGFMGLNTMATSFAPCSPPLPLLAPFIPLQHRSAPRSTV
ncbi:hypothetical protein L226DRAFT_614140 [Lentinus tigrinus ALCF2SS1-7]|uniref:Fungal-type protein kinase domain-containing protein n=1 Tax=Lentinus tigrinus ALCF2SS1-6 TaxID=1328759 RepID=A0A5C2S6F2_9APHY|nr:hypothetical protein L227DRAFT_654306 [Lentinus tigrinus ALCF2SS1-6]RPD73648.1 hypothetical protein L226DRAFT_614140 [Lentinus tigrinus ALCF2SS1-7]